MQSEPDGANLHASDKISSHALVLASQLLATPGCSHKFPKATFLCGSTAAVASHVKRCAAGIVVRFLGALTKQMDNQIRDARLQLAALHPSDKRAQALRLLSEMELSKQKKNDHIDGCGNYLNNSDQKSKDHLRLIRWLRGGVFGAFFIGASTPFTFHAVDNETAAHVIAIVGWLSICALPLLMPAISLLSGRISSVGGVTCKEVEPVRFWVGLITHEALALFFAFLATLMFHMHLIDRN